MPEKAAEMEKALSKYLEEIDAEDVQDVYQARLEELDHFESQAQAIYKKDVERLHPVADLKQIEKLAPGLKGKVKRFEKNRKEVETNRKSTHWAGSPPKQL